MDTLTYAPWVPRDCNGGMFRHLVAAWGNPNSHGSKWPAATLGAVCERGEPRPLVFDQHAASSRIYFLRGNA